MPATRTATPTPPSTPRHPSSPAALALAALAALLAAGGTPLAAADKNKTYLTPAEAAVDPDYAVQGEYQGLIEGKKFGAHLVAEGGGKFLVVLYPGGLPGDGWDGERKDRIKGKGVREEDGGEDVVISFDKAKWGATQSQGKITLTAANRRRLGTLERVERESPTLGKKPPAGAVVLFDGSGVEHWDKGRMTDDGLLMQGTTSKPTFQSCQIHLEFRTPYKPGARGQGRGNSGFYAQGRYEVQVLDSFGLEGEHNECGGIYSTRRPDMNLCYPPLAWQTYDVEFTAAQFDASGKKTSDARMTVRHNGVVVHEDVVCDHATTASRLREGPEPGPIYFQDHGNPVRFRNIWVVPRK